MTIKAGIVVAILGGAFTVCALMAWHLVTQDAWDLSNSAVRGNTASAATMQAGAGVVPPESVPLEVRLADHPAVRYAHAMLDNDCETVIGLTLWMGERLQHARIHGGDDGHREARDALCRRVFERRLEDAEWSTSGVEDRFVFQPGARVEILGLEEGRRDLERTAMEGVRFRVAYATPERALRDASGTPIQSLETVVWVSREGLVLKAGVIGDAEVDPGSFGYAWRERAPQ